jgi:hypothetical protein
MPLNEAVSVLVYENGIRFSRTLQPCRQVYRTAKNRVIEPLLRAKVTNGAKPRGNAHAHMQAPGGAELLPVFLQFRDTRAHANGHLHALQRIFGLSFTFRVSEENQHRISDELVDRAAAVDSDRGHLR